MMNVIQMKKKINLLNKKNKKKIKLELIERARFLRYLMQLRILRWIMKMKILVTYKKKLKTMQETLTYAISKNILLEIAN